MLGLIILSFVAPILAGLWGGRTERFGVAALLLSRMVFASPRVMWVVDDIYIDSLVEDTLVLLTFGWMAFRLDRWWTFVATAALALTVLVHVFSIVTDISWAAAVSARVGLGLILYLALLAGVAERWLAGEQAAACRRRWRRRPPPPGLEPPGPPVRHREGRCPDRRGPIGLRVSGGQFRA